MSKVNIIQCRMHRSFTSDRVHILHLSGHVVEVCMSSHGSHLMPDGFYADHCGNGCLVPLDVQIGHHRMSRSTEDFLLKTKFTQPKISQ